MRSLALALSPLAAAVTLALTAPVATAATYTWSAGNFAPGTTAPHPLPAADTLVINGPALKTFNSGVSFTNDGTVQMQAGSGGLGVAGGATVINNGSWEDQGTGTLTDFNAAGGSFTNNGTFTKSGAGLSVLVPLTLTNNGTIDVQQGTLRLPLGFVNDGTLTGAGNLQVSGAGLTNNGTLAPGSGVAGALGLNGNYTQSAGGVFALDLASALSFDSLSIQGSAVLDGTLALNCLGACSFVAGDFFTVLSATNSLSGTFASVTLNGFAAGLGFDVLYGQGPAASVSLRVTQGPGAGGGNVPEPATYALLLPSLMWLGFMNRRRRR